MSDAIRDVINGVPPEQRWMHAYTYSGHPTCCAVALRNLQIIEDEALVERAAIAGRRLLDRLMELQAVEGVGDVRDLGLMAAVEVVADTATKQPFPLGAQITQRLGDTLLARGLFTRLVADTICLAPPLVTTDEQIDRIVAIIGEAIPAVIGDLAH